MTTLSSRFMFASPPDSWGVLDYPGPSWGQSYQTMLDEMVLAGYTGTELVSRATLRTTSSFQKHRSSSSNSWTMSA
jgi:hypothetical protein